MFDNKPTKSEVWSKNILDAEIIISDMSITMISPWDIRNASFKNYGTGWCTNYPLLKSISYPELLDNDSLSIVIDSDYYKLFCDLLEHSFEKQYNKKIYFDIIEEKNHLHFFLLKSMEIHEARYKKIHQINETSPYII